MPRRAHLRGIPPWRQPRSKWMVCLVHSHTMPPESGGICRILICSGLPPDVHTYGVSHPGDNHPGDNSFFIARCDHSRFLGWPCHLCTPHRSLVISYSRVLGSFSLFARKGDRSWWTVSPTPRWRQPRGKWMVILVSSFSQG